MIINVRDIPEEGLQLEGEIREDIFQLAEKDIRFEGPIRYRFLANIVSNSLLVQGDVEAGFEMHCVRCLNAFPKRIELKDLAFSEPIEGRATIDLTESIREDILLALPVHPRCEDGTPPRDCPARGKFEEPEDLGDEASGEGSAERNVWADLEGFDPSSPE